MSKVYELSTKEEQVCKDIQEGSLELIQEMKDLVESGEAVEVFVVWRDREKTCYFKRSAYSDVTGLVGAIEIMKHEILSN